MRKKVLEKRLARLQAKKNALTQRALASEDANEVRSINEQISDINDDIADVQEEIDAIDEDEKGGDPTSTEGTIEPEQRDGAPVAIATGIPQVTPLAAYGQTRGTAIAADPVNNDPRATMEYRMAFMNYVQKGEKSDVLLTRSNDQNELNDLGVLIPTTVIQEIIKGVEKVRGQLYSRVKKTNLKGGIKYPIGSFSATFNRIGENGAPTDRQSGGSITGYVEFGYKLGEIRLAQTLLMSTMGVTIFEQELTKVLVEAYVEAMDKEILTGVSSNNEMCGILTDDTDGLQKIAADHVISFSAADMKDWKKWQTKLFAKIPLSMRGLRPEFVMAVPTFEANIETLEDANGQPVARNIYNPTTGAETATFKGKEVIFVEEDMFKAFDDCSSGEYFGMYWVPDKAYAINSNLEFAYKRYWDEEKNQWVQKGIVINDGKILDPKYIFLLKKA